MLISEMAESNKNVPRVSLVKKSLTDCLRYGQGKSYLSNSPDKEGIYTTDLTNEECSLLDQIAPNEPAGATKSAEQHLLGTMEDCSESKLTSADKENCIPTVASFSDEAVSGPDHVATNAPQPEQARTDAPLTPGRLTEADDAEVVRRARDEGRVDVVFPGSLTQEGCCRLICEILKCILYQRQQLPMTYDQLVYSQKKHEVGVQGKEIVGWRPPVSGSLDWRKCQRTLQELEELLQHLEELFSLSLVPRALLLLGGSVILPKELYEVNMEAVNQAAGDCSLRVSTCLRRLFRTLFVADLLSDARPVRLMTTTVMVLAHRDCGVGWFRPKLDFKIPARVKSQVIVLSSDPGTCETPQRGSTDWQDYVWFQAPVAIKGFSK